MRLIDADKLIIPDEKTAKCLIVGGRGGGGKTLALAFNVARQRIADAPTIDAVPVVRCKDCKHFTPVEGGIPFCAWHSIGCGENEFCSYGERKDGEGL